MQLNRFGSTGPLRPRDAPDEDDDNDINNNGYMLLILINIILSPYSIFIQACRSEEKNPQKGQGVGLVSAWQEKGIRCVSENLSTKKNKERYH